MEWGCDDLRTLLPDKHAAHATRPLIDRRGTESAAEQAIKHGRRASSLHVPECRRAEGKSNVGLRQPIGQDRGAAGTLGDHDDRAILATLIHLTDVRSNVVGFGINLWNHNDFRASGDSAISAR